ncbi:MAG: rhodanese-like domain-containing protein [Deltaproteobacteria bacterium HGW-Deltaproteobacteria-23]|nr:MAG: rhodanese-like domain-containing protein [Deltaproteobacteria bacterium HGW-Deltaproteobacteria-23]
MQPADLIKRIKSKQAPVILDVRSNFEFGSGHIPGSIHAPTWKILLRLAKIPTDKSAELVVTCEHGPRAQLAKGLLVFLGYSDVTLLEGHMAAWKKSGGSLVL